MPIKTSTQLSSSSNLVTKSTAAVTIAQDVFSALGFEDKRADIIAGNLAHNGIYRTLSSSIELYNRDPSPKNNIILTRVLKKEIKRLRSEYHYIKAKQDKYQSEANKVTARPATQSTRWYNRLYGSLKSSVQTFFGSDNQSLVEKYAELAETRQVQIDKLTKYLDEISKKTVKQPLRLNSEKVKIVQKSVFPATINFATLNGLTGVSFTLPTTAGDSPISSAVSSAGDINDDGITDFMVGYPIFSNGVGSVPGLTCVIFGHSGDWITPFSLSNLNGINGLIFNGEYAWDQSGNSVSFAGDINGDGTDDLIIGAPGANQVGTSYLIFGHSGNWVFPFSLANLNGTNGVKFIGEENIKDSGLSVSLAGDINGDEIDDFIIGASGTAYVIFGHTGNWISPFSLSALNGLNGIKFIAGKVGDGTGLSVSSAGDVNGDGIDDLMIGSPYANNNIGTTSLVFGHRGTWSTPFLLSSLNGLNGVIFTGENPNDECGISVSKAGDVNGDGLDDLVIGSLSANNADGTAYLVFGHIGSWSTPFFLSSLNGFNGAKLIGGGTSVSQAGDINSDGINDLFIGAPKYNANGGNTGASYVVFGYPGAWATPFSLSNLNGENGIIFIGYSTEYSGVSVNTVGDVNGDGLTDLMVGTISGTSSGTNIVSNLVFGDNPSLSNNQLIITEGSVSWLNNTNLMTRYSSNPVLTLFSITQIQHGHFELVTQPGRVINSFNELQISNNQVGFFQDGSCAVPAYQVSVVDGGIALSSTPEDAEISFNPIIPNITNNLLAAIPGQPVILTTWNLNATSPGDLRVNIRYTVSSIEHGQFYYINDPSKSITQFSQPEIDDNKVQFVPDKSGIKPTYVLVAQDSCGWVSDPSSATIFFHYFPVLEINQLTINQGQQLTFTAANLYAINPNNANISSILLFVISKILSGHFEMICNPGEAINSFYQKNITDGIVQFIHDGSNQAPSYDVSVDDGILNTDSEAATIVFNPTNPPEPSNSSSDDSIIKAIIVGTVAGGIGIAFAIAKLYIEKKAKDYMEDEEKDSYRKTVVVPISKEISRHIKMGSFLGYMNQQTTQNLVLAVLEVISKLENIGINAERQMKSEPRRSRFMIQTAFQTRRQLLGQENTSCCNCNSCSCTPEVTPEQISDNANAIAASIKRKLNGKSASHPDDSLRLQSGGDNPKMQEDSSSMHNPLLLSSKLTRSRSASWASLIVDSNNKQQINDASSKIDIKLN